MCSHNNNIPINIPGHPYVLMNRSILCNCDVKAESNFLLELLVACKGSEKKNRFRNALYNKFGFHELFQWLYRRVRNTSFKKLDNP